MYNLCNKIHVEVDDNFSGVSLSTTTSGDTEIVITGFLSFNGSIAAYQSLQLDAGVTTAESHCCPVRYRVLIAQRNNLKSIFI